MIESSDVEDQIREALNAAWQKWRSVPSLLKNFHACPSIAQVPPSHARTPWCKPVLGELPQ